MVHHLVTNKTHKYSNNTIPKNEMEWILCFGALLCPSRVTYWNKHLRCNVREVLNVGLDYEQDNWLSKREFHSSPPNLRTQQDNSPRDRKWTFMKQRVCHYLDLASLWNCDKQISIVYKLPSPWWFGLEQIVMSVMKTNQRCKSISHVWHEHWYGDIYLKPGL